MQINKEELRLWINALKSGYYKQTRSGRLQDQYGYSSVGVACIVMIPTEKLKLESDGYLFGALAVSQPNSPSWLQDFSKDFHKKHGTSPDYLNDTGSSFLEIANLLEKYYFAVMTPAELLVQRWLVLGNWPGRQKDRYKTGEIITESTDPKELPKNQYGELRFPLQWEESPLLFKKLNWWEEREIEIMKSVKYIKNFKRNQFYEVLQMVPAFSITEDKYSFKAKNRRGQEIVGYVELTEDYIPITEEEFKLG